MRLLLIEDEDGIRRALQVHLRRDGHQVTAVASLTEARQVLDSQSFEGVVSDLKLPDGMSLDLLESVGLPVVLMSGYAVFEDAVRAIRVGCVDFLTKPVPKEALLRAVGRLQPQQHGPSICLPHEEPSVQTQWLDCRTGQRHVVHAERLEWESPTDLQDRWQPPSCGSARIRQLDAELCQLSPAASLVRNHQGGKWRWYFPLRSSANGRDVVLVHDAVARQAFIRDLADQVTEFDEGLYVEASA
jgi:CheY-like chemotaxis protein